MAVRVYSTWLQGKIDKCLSAGLTVTDTARMLGLDRMALRSRLKRRETGDPGWNDIKLSFVENKATNARDDRTLAIYNALLGDVGQTVEQIAALTKYDAESVLADLKYLERGRLANCDRGRWFFGKTKESD